MSTLPHTRPLLTLKQSIDYYITFQRSIGNLGLERDEADARKIQHMVSSISRSLSGSSSTSEQAQKKSPPPPEPDFNAVIETLDEYWYPSHLLDHLTPLSFEKIFTHRHQDLKQYYAIKKTTDQYNHHALPCTQEDLKEILTRYTSHIHFECVKAPYRVLKEALKRFERHIFNTNTTRIDTKHFTSVRAHSDELILILEKCIDRVISSTKTRTSRLKPTLPMSKESFFTAKKDSLLTSFNDLILTELSERSVVRQSGYTLYSKMNIPDFPTDRYPWLYRKTIGTLNVWCFSRRAQKLKIPVSIEEWKVYSPNKKKDVCEAYHLATLNKSHLDHLNQLTKIANQILSDLRCHLPTTTPTVQEKKFVSDLQKLIQYVKKIQLHIHGKTDTLLTLNPLVTKHARAESTYCTGSSSTASVTFDDLRRRRESRRMKATSICDELYHKP